MHHERDRGDHNEHHRRDRIKKETELDCQVAIKMKPVEIEHEVLQTLAVGGNEIGVSGEEISKRCEICKTECDTHACSAEDSGPFMAHELPENTQEEEHKQRNGKY